MLAVRAAVVLVESVSPQHCQGGLRKHQLERVLLSAQFVEWRVVRGNRDLKPSVAQCASTLRALRAEGQQAESGLEGKVIEGMRDHGVEPDMVTYSTPIGQEAVIAYNSLIRTFARRKQPGEREVDAAARAHYVVAPARRQVPKGAQSDAQRLGD